MIDIAPPENARRAPQRLACLEAQAHRRSRRSRCARLIELEDVDIDAFRRLRNLTDAIASQAARRRGSRAVDCATRARSRCPNRNGQRALESLAAQISAYHKAAPHSQGLKADQIRRTGVVPKHWLDDALAALAAAGTIGETGGHFHDPKHRAALPPEEAAVFKRIQTAISGHGSAAQHRRPREIVGDAAALCSTRSSAA